MSSQNHLIRPSSHVPWDVQVTGSIPSSLLTDLSQTAASMHPDKQQTGALHGQWACLLIGNKIHLWNTNDDTQKPFLLYHPSLGKTHVKIAMHSRTSELVHVYAISPSVTSTTLIMVWVVRKGQRVSGMGQSPSCKAVIEGDDISAIQAMEGGLLLGTCKNLVYWAHLNPKPTTLNIQKLPKSSSTGILGYVFGTTVSSNDDPIHALFLKDTTVLTLTTTGHVELYNVTRKAGNLLSDHVVLGSLGALLEENPKMQLLQATVKNNQIYAIYLADDKVHFIDASVNSATSAITLNNSEWLSRFHSTVQCVGLFATDNDMLYAVLSYPNESVACLALNKSMEVDLPKKQVPAVFVVGKDTVTHGCHMITSTGAMVRAQWVQLQKPTTVTTTNYNPMLASHLSSIFWHSYRSATGGMPLPPSLQTAKANDLESVIIAVALQIQQEGDASSLKNPMEWHSSLLTFLKQNGLYRSVSNQGRWHLLGIGQELAVHVAIGTNHHQLLKDLLPHGVAPKFKLVQQHVLGYTIAEVKYFCDALCCALEAAQQYRTEQAVDTYDVLLDGHPSHLWTHQSALQELMVTQLEYWRDSGTKLDPVHVKTVAKACLSSFSESSHKKYDQVKDLAIHLVRAVNDDTLAFDLSQEHRWFEGLCQLSLDHRKDEYFRIDSLLSEWDESFGRFVLQWHIDCRQYGQVFRHGEHVPELLTEFLEKDDRLRPHRWIHSIFLNDHDTASLQLMEHASVTTTCNLHDTKWALSMALLSNRASKHPNKRREIIDARLDLVKAQEILLPDDDGPLKASEQLFMFAMKRLNESTTLEESIQMCMAGVSIARANDDNGATASLVWGHAIEKDSLKWEQWISTSKDLTSEALRNTILDTTVFGGLWKALQGLSLEYHSVQYDAPLEQRVLEGLGWDDVGKTEMKRLLRSVTSVQLETGVSKSLVVSSYGTNSS